MFSSDKINETLLNFIATILRHNLTIFPLIFIEFYFAFNHKFVNYMLQNEIVSSFLTNFLIRLQSILVSWCCCRYFVSSFRMNVRYCCLWAHKISEVTPHKIIFIGTNEISLCAFSASKAFVAKLSNANHLLVSVGWMFS